MLCITSIARNSTFITKDGLFKCGGSIDLRNLYLSYVVILVNTNICMCYHLHCIHISLLGKGNGYLKQIYLITEVYILMNKIATLCGVVQLEGLAY